MRSTVSSDSILLMVLTLGFLPRHCLTSQLRSNTDIEAWSRSTSGERQSATMALIADFSMQDLVKIRGISRLVDQIEHQSIDYSLGRKPWQIEK
jgi:hypothetical protein